MPRKPRLRTLAVEVAERFPDLADPVGAILAGHVSVDGIVARNPRSLVHPGAPFRLARDHPLRGSAKLEFALARFAVPVRGRTALDLGAAAGGFTRGLLDHGASRVYAVDVGHGQLVGSLRGDPAVVNLERTNLAQLDEQLVPDMIDVVTVDLSYLALASALGQLGRIRLATGADLVALVKPMFELRLARPPAHGDAWEEAVHRATEGARAAGWAVRETCRSPVRGTRGAVEFLLHGVSRRR